METPILRAPSKRRLTNSLRYLRDNGGMEIMPCLWIHPIHTEVIVVDPEGGLRVYHDRMIAVAWRCHWWRFHLKPSVCFTEADWPQLREQWQPRPRVQ